LCPHYHLPATFQSGFLVLQKEMLCMIFSELTRRNLFRTGKNFSKAFLNKKSRQYNEKNIALPAYDSVHIKK